jgi:hypothetical protein
LWEEPGKIESEQHISEKVQDGGNKKPSWQK